MQPDSSNPSIRTDINCPNYLNCFITTNYTNYMNFYHTEFYL